MFFLKHHNYSIVLLVVNVLIILVHSNNSQNNCSIHLLALRVHNIWCLFSTRVSVPLLPLSPISAFITTILHCMLLPVKFILHQFSVTASEIHSCTAPATTSEIHSCISSCYYQCYCQRNSFLHQLLLLLVNSSCISSCCCQ